MSCAPRSNPPAGRQLLADRVSSPRAFVRPNGDGITRLVLTRPGKSAFTQDFYVLAFDPASSAPPTQQLLVAGLATPLGSGCGQRGGGCFETDARGRLLLSMPPLSGELVADLLRADPVTGELFDLGPTYYHELSPDGQRLLVHGPPSEDLATLYDEDERVIPLGSIQTSTFIGAFLYYVDDQQRLSRLAVGGTPEVIATGVDSFVSVTTAGAPLFQLYRPATAPPNDMQPSQITPDTVSFLDTVTLQETPSPVSDRGFDVSPDGAWLLVPDYVADDITFIDRATGAQQVIPSVTTYQWRPGHDEAWLSDPQAPTDTIAIRKPGAALQQITGRLYPVPCATAQPDLDQQMAAFTPDGAYWFSNTMPYGRDSLWQVGSADDPAGPLFPVTPRGSQPTVYWPLADGRLLAPAWTSNPDRSDVYVVDPRTGDRVVMGEEGSVIAVGGTRFLMIQRVNEYEGDLTSIALATGQSTMLAPEFTLGAFVQPPATDGGDPVAPGAQVVFQYQARYPSPYDGIWVAAVP